MDASALVHTIQGRPVTMPVEVRDASSGAASFLVDLGVARRLVDVSGIEPEEFLPGKAMLSIAMVDYRDNDLGDYHELSIAFFVREKGKPRRLPWVGSWFGLMRSQVATYIRHLPVDQSFTCDAGRMIWGFPKTVQEVDIRYEGDRARARLVMDGMLVLELSMPRGGGRDLPTSELATYSRVRGRTCRTPFTSSTRGFGIFTGSRVTLELGDHPIAAELRELGLPKEPLVAMWMEHWSGSFGEPVPLES